MVSNQSFSENVGVIRSSTEELRISSKDITEISKLLSGQTDLLLHEVTSLPPAVKAISDKLDTISPSKDNVPIANDIGKNTDDLSSKIMPVGISLALYALIRSYETEKPINYGKIVKGPVWSSWMGSCLSCIMIMQPDEIILSKEKDESDNSDLFKVDSIGRFNFVKMRRRVDRNKDAGVKKLIDEIDEYFRPSSEETTEEEKLNPQ